MMLVPSTAIGLFTSILKRNNFDVDLFDTTSYEHPATTSAEKRVETLQYRQFDPESDLGFIPIPGERLISDFKKKINEFEPDLILVSVVEDTFLQAIELISSGIDKTPILLLEGVFEKSELILVVTHNLIVTVCNSTQLQWLLDADLNVPIDVFVALKAKLIYGEITDSAK